MTVNPSYSQANPPEFILKGTKDTVPEFIEKLQNSNNITVKIRKDIDNLLAHPKKNQIININQIPTTHLRETARKTPIDIRKKIALKLKNIPAFIVTTKDGNIITASWNQFQKSDSQAIKKPLQQTKTGKSIFLFFMEKEDASMYLQEVCKQEPQQSEHSGLRIEVVNLGLFYELNRDINCKIETKLIADLNEINLVLQHKIKSDFYSLNPKQKRSTNYFQGTPVYKLKDTKDPKKNLLIKTTEELQRKEYKLFFRLEDALSFWKSHRETKNIPNIELYNLESLLIEMEDMPQESTPNYEFCNHKTQTHLSYYPSQGEIQNLHPYKVLEKFLFNTKLKSTRFQRLYKSLLDVVSSGTVPTENNL
jgi:hypothetical protein